MSPIKQLLSRHGLAVQPNGAIVRLVGTGGLSGAELWRFPSRLGWLLIRGWPPEVTAQRVQTIHGWLARLRHLPFLACPIPSQDGSTLHIDRSGRCWELMPWLPGSASLQSPTSGQAASALDAVGQVHRELALEGSVRVSSGAHARIEFLNALQAREMREFEAELSRRPPDDNPEGFESLARVWVKCSPLKISRALEMLRRQSRRAVWVQPCLRDLRPEHLLFEGDRLSGLVDYGAMDAEAPETDLARLLPAWIGNDPALQRHACLAYQSANPGHVLDEPLLAAFSAANSVLIGGQWMRWILLQRRSFSDPAAHLLGIRLSLRLMEQPIDIFLEPLAIRRPD